MRYLCLGLPVGPLVEDEPSGPPVFWLDSLALVFEVVGDDFRRDLTR